MFRIELADLIIQIENRFDYVRELCREYITVKQCPADLSISASAQEVRRERGRMADIIISDYSSFVIESSLADKPLYIYAYDLEEYEVNTGLNIDFAAEPVAPYVFRDAVELAEAIDKNDYDVEILHAFRDRYIDIDTSNCTAGLADFIEGLM